jgi:hypothetical protein
MAYHFVLLGQVITHHLPLSEAARGYKIFDNKYEEDGKTMVCKVRWRLVRHMKLKLVSKPRVYCLFQTKVFKQKRPNTDAHV